MKKLSIEEKAQRYDNAIEIAKSLYDYNQPISASNVIINNIFPELKESGDERIRKALIDYFNRYKEQDTIGIETFNGVPTNNILAWLEKQGEQKPTDNVEPKFKIGDWVVYDHRAYKVVTLPREGCINLGLKRNGKLEFAPSTYCRPWTIQDAKDGDVLVHSSFMFDDFIFIYNNTSILQAYCYYSNERNRFIVEDRGHHCPWNMQEVTPTTKEQRDTLMKAMDDAGYTFDFVKKELKKIEQKPVEWGEEDDILLNDAIYTIKEGERFENELKHENCHDSHTYQVIISWLKSLKERVQPQQKWKPSDKQMEVLQKYAKQSNYDGMLLTSLYNDLKKLREELL